MEQTQETKWSDDEKAMIELLHSMGVTKFDASIPTALNEYAKSMLPLITLSAHYLFMLSHWLLGYAAEILSDGKDFSVYAGKKVGFNCENSTSMCGY